MRAQTRKTLGVVTYWVEMSPSGGWLGMARFTDKPRESEYRSYCITRWGAHYAARRLAKNMNRYRRYINDV